MIRDLKDGEYTAHYDRKSGTIDGLFTLMLDGQPYQIGKKKLQRLGARSGQSRCADTNFTRGCSPIPHLEENRKNKKPTEYWLWTHSIDEYKPAGAAGIGWFFPISNTGSPERTMFGKFVRIALGLHPENRKRGSAGCIVILSWAEFIIIGEVLKALNKKGVKRIKLFVW